MRVWRPQQHRCELVLQRCLRARCSSISAKAAFYWSTHGARPGCLPSCGRPRPGCSGAHPICWPRIGAPTSRRFRSPRNRLSSSVFHMDAPPPQQPGVFWFQTPAGECRLASLRRSVSRYASPGSLACKQVAAKPRGCETRTAQPTVSRCRPRGVRGEPSPAPAWRRVQRGVHQRRRKRCGPAQSEVATGLTQETREQRPHA